MSPIGSFVYFFHSTKQTSCMFKENAQTKRKKKPTIAYVVT